LSIKQPPTLRAARQNLGDKRGHSGMIRSMLKSLLILLAAGPLLASEWVDLWPGEAPGAKRPAAGSEATGDGGRISNVEAPQYRVYLPPKDKATGAAVVVFPGGGYTILAADHEGHEYAEWLAQRGIAGIVVKYRVSNQDDFGYSYPVPFLDARRAIRTVRANAAAWGVDPAKVGVMGSSAGGHLASLCTTRFEDQFAEEGGDEIDAQSCRPDFSILIYPVISMDDPLGHGGSRRRLLGAEPSREMIERLSTERAVTAETPPVFLLTTADDWVDCRNSLEFAAACKAHGVAVALHLFERGGHGYGLRGKDELAAWPGLLEQWLAGKTGR
jgi:acetyl esterase/lipase